MIRYNIEDHQYHAVPTFVCPGMGYNDPKPEGIWSNPWTAFLRLIPYLPEPYQTKARGVDLWRMYRAPEYIHPGDRCVDIDGHKPNKTEWAKRRADFLLARKLGHQTF